MKEKYKTTIKSVGSSIYIIIPAYFKNRNNLKPGTELEVTIKNV